MNYIGQYMESAAKNSVDMLRLICTPPPVHSVENGVVECFRCGGKGVQFDCCMRLLLFLNLLVARRVIVILMSANQNNYST